MDSMVYGDGPIHAADGLTRLQMRENIVEKLRRIWACGEVRPRVHSLEEYRPTSFEERERELESIRGGRAVQHPKLR